MKMKWIGLTGGIATGKSTVAKIFQKKGIPVVDADKMAHQALVASSPVFAELVAAFGKDIVGRDGNIDRKLLGQKIFQDSKARLRLDGIVHPFVRNQVAAEKRKLVQTGARVAIYDVPLLFEKKMQDDFDLVVVVACEAKIQKERLMKRNSLSSQEADLRIAAQLPLSEKIKSADHVIHNNTSIDDLEKQVDQFLKTVGV